MKKQMTLLNWNSEQAESITGKFQSAGWNVAKENDDFRYSYRELLKKTPGVFMSSSGAGNGQTQDNSHDSLAKRNTETGLPDFI